MKKIAVVLFNLGGPDTPEAIRPFLFNLFSDKRIITAPLPVRKLIALLISTTRAPKVKPLYAEMGGASPILSHTLAQAEALEALLNQNSEIVYRCYIAMRYWHPRCKKVIQQIQADGMDEVILLPLYPQFSTTTTESSFYEWQVEARRAGLNLPVHSVGCYPVSPLFIKAEAALIRPLLEQALREHPSNPPRLIFSAHGLPQKIITGKGDPYVWQVEQTAEAIIKELSKDGIFQPAQGAAPSGRGSEAGGSKPPHHYDYIVSYQSRVGPVEWVRPYTDDTIRAAGEDGKPVIIAPIAFVSEHIETLVELDIENKHLAEASGCAGYWRVPTVSTHPDFIEALAEEVKQALITPKQPVCPPEYSACICKTQI